MSVQPKKIFLMLPTNFTLPITLQVKHVVPEFFGSKIKLTLRLKCPEVFSSSSKSNLYFISNAYPTSLSHIPTKQHSNTVNYSGTLLIIQLPIGQKNLAVLKGWPYLRGFFLTRECMAVFTRQPKKVAVIIR